VTGVALVKTSCSPSILLKYMLFCFFPRYIYFAMH
jgi:hypothetical protein